MNSSTRFVGRALEMGRVGGLLDEVRAGHAAGVLIGGPAGVGKTRLLAEAARTAESREMTVASSACLPLTAALPFDAVVELLRQLRIPVRMPTGGSQHELFGQVISRFEVLAARDPLLLCVDDLQWSDAGTLELIHYCLARLRDLPIGWVLTARPGRGAELLAHRLDRAGLVDRIELGPLSSSETRVLAEELLGVDQVNEELVDVLLERAGGNPLLCEQLLQGLPVVGLEPGGEILPVLAELVPQGVIDAVAERVDRLSPVLREALGWAAVLPIPFTFLDLELVGGPEAAGSPEALAEAGFLISDRRSGWSFVHSVVRDAVYHALPEAERVRRHGIVADTLAEGPLERRAPQLAKAGRSDEAARAYLDLARAALDRGQGEDATRLYDQARELGVQAHDARLEHAALGGRVLGLLRSDLVDEARQEADEVRGLLRHSSGDGERLAFLVAYASALDNDAVDRLGAQAVLSEAEPLIGRAEGAALAEALTVRAMVLWKSENPASALRDAEQAAQLAGSIGSQALEVRADHALGVAVGITRSAQAAISVLEEVVGRARAAGMSAEEARLRLNLGYFFELVGDIEGQEAHTRRGLEIEGAPVALITLLHQNLGSARQDLGDLDGALAHTLAGQRLAARASQQIQARIAIALALVHAYRGELAAARRLLEEHSRRYSGMWDARAALTWGLLLEAEDSLAEALASFQRAAAASDDPVSVWGLAGVARTAVAIGEVAVAREGLTQLGQLAARWPFSHWHCAASRAWLAAAEGRTADAIADFDAAADACTEALPATRLRLQAARLAHDRERVTAVIGEFEHMGARREADRGRAMARELGIRPGRRHTRTGLLSDREQEVAQLVAAGRTNAEIGAALYISTRTVERHVGNILAKLGFRSRVQIAAEAAAGRLPGTRP